jgi:hypothetical protein
MFMFMFFLFTTARAWRNYLLARILVGRPLIKLAQRIGGLLVYPIQACLLMALGPKHNQKSSVAEELMRLAGRMARMPKGSMTCKGGNGDSI